MWQSRESEMTFDFRRTPTARFYSLLPGHHTSTAGYLCRGMCPGEQERVVELNASRGISLLSVVRW